MLSLLSFTLLALSASRASAHAFARDAPAANLTNSTVEMVAAAWYTGWHAENFTLANVTWDKYTHMTYSFAETTPGNISLNGSDPELLPQFVSTAHNNDVKALISVGGWSGGIYYSSNVGSAENRTSFVKTITSFAQAYNLDGVDFDWEYPNSQGIGCNVISPNDTANFLSFLKELRADPVGAKLILTASAPVTPWKDATGTSSSDVSAFAAVFDWINIMNYDIWGSWAKSVGPNAPLNDTCADTADQQGSAVSAIAAWSKAGIPAHQLVLGVASYGHSFHVEPTSAFDSNNTEALASYPAFNATLQPLGDAWDNLTNTDSCGVTSGPSGNFDFWGLIDEGFLFPNGSVADGIAYRYDECSQTPYVYNETSKVMVSFDNAQSFAAKGAFIKDSGLRGFQMWETGGDSGDILLDAIRQGAGFVEPESDC
ncbi:chitinase [Amylocystis lapponica]|nr:chitinase [Amylocystis lapponica]